MPKKTFRQKRGSKRTSKKRASQRGGIFEKRAHDRQTPGKRKYTLSSPRTTSTSISQPPIIMDNNVAHPFSIPRTENPGFFEPRDIYTQKQLQELKMQKQAEKEAKKQQQQAQLVAQLKHLEDEQRQAQLLAEQQHQAQLLEDEQQRKNLHERVIEAFIQDLNDLIGSKDSKTCSTFFIGNEERIKKLNDPLLDNFLDNNREYIVSSIIKCICFKDDKLTHEGRKFIEYVGSLHPNAPVFINRYQTEKKYRRIIENPIYLKALEASRLPPSREQSNPWYKQNLW